MVRRSLFGWMLAGAFCASVSCGGSNNGTTPQGFGLPCKASKDCASYDLFCGDGATCVECRGDGDCDSEEICRAGLCAQQDTCKNSRDCSGDQVCDQDAGVCVDCVTSQDCATAQKCSNSTCEDRPVCEYTSDCKAGLVCDIGLKACVSCRNDDDCGSRRVCEDYECVLPAPVDTGGSNAGGSSTMGGASTGGSGIAGMAGTGTAGTLTGGASGAGGASGSGGSIAEGGAGGATDCGCSLNETCTPDLRCVAPTLIDDLQDCDGEILAIEGRKGDWAAAADTGINIMHGFTDPGSGWADHTCAAWAAGGELTVDDPNATFAFIGFRLNVNAQDEGLPYDLSDYDGIQLTLESDSSVQVVLKTTGGGYFQVTLAPQANGSHVRVAPFLSMLEMANSKETVLDLSTVYEVQFSVTDPTSFGLAIHRVSLY